MECDKYDGTSVLLGDLGRDLRKPLCLAGGIVRIRSASTHVRGCTPDSLSPAPRCGWIVAFSSLLVSRPRGIRS